MDTYTATLAALFPRTTQGVKLGLATTRQLLRALDEPQRHLRCVVVAGTNGKGSTSFLLAEALRAAGLRVGLFTSPHLLRFTERIRINGAEIEPQQVTRLFQRITAAERACGCTATFFECATAMAILAFAEAAVDIAVLEVGLGGRLDATNVVDKTLAVITPIAFDHEHLLGSTLSAIAAEKAAVIPEGGVVVSAPQRPEAEEVIVRTAASRGARVLRAPEVERTTAGWRLGGRDWQSPVALQTLPAGAYQRVNLATAAAACRHVLDTLGRQGAVARAMKAAVDQQWTGRYQWLEGPPAVLLDGAHNPAGLSALLDALRLDPRLEGRPIHCVFTALKTKRAETMLSALRHQVASVHLCPTTSKRTYTVDELAALSCAERVHASTGSALAAATEAASRDDGRVLVTGSLFLVADALAALTGAARDPAVDG